MMQSMSFLRFYVGVTLIIAGCGDSTSSGSDDPMGGTEVRGLGGEPNTGSGGMTTMVDPPKGGTGGTPTIMPMGGETMTGGIVQQNPCDRICGKYAECDRSAIGPGVGKRAVWPRVPHSMSCLRSTII